MIRVIAQCFGGPEVLQVVEEPTPQPSAGEVLVRLTSIGMNHADLMARRGEYKLYSGEPPFTPGLEGGGIIEAVGAGVTTRAVGQRVILSLGAPRKGGGGTYRSHYVTRAEETVPAPAKLPDEASGALWLAYLTAWGCLVWKQEVCARDTVIIPAASSSVGLAAAQVANNAGAKTIGLTTHEIKIDAIRRAAGSSFHHLLITHDDAGQVRPWYRDIRQLTGGAGATVIFDPVGAGDYLEAELKALAAGGTIWIYGLLGKPAPVDLSPLIRKKAAIRGWIVGELNESPAALEAGVEHVLQKFEKGSYELHVAKTYPLMKVRQAHEEMEKAGHVGKLILIP